VRGGVVAAQYVLQLRVALVGILPPIWRRIQVPWTATFWDLHVAIQDSMGWAGEHLHEFQVPDHRLGRLVRVGIPDDEYPTGKQTLRGWEVGIADYFQGASPAAVYLYDFGDSWAHVVQYEGDVPARRGAKYPRCVGGERKCPPEDCGGIPGYADLLEALADPGHPEHESLRAWVGGPFDSEEFDPTAVELGDPKARRLEIDE
jgi:hypothetical protein